MSIKCCNFCFSGDFEVNSRFCAQEDIEPSDVTPHISCSTCIKSYHRTCFSLSQLKSTQGFNCSNVNLDLWCEQTDTAVSAAKWWEPSSSYMCVTVRQEVANFSKKLILSDLQNSPYCNFGKSHVFKKKSKENTNRKSKISNVNGRLVTPKAPFVFSKLYGVNATIIIFLFVLYFIVFEFRL